MSTELAIALGIIILVLETEMEFTITPRERGRDNKTLFVQGPIKSLHFVTNTEFGFISGHAVRFLSTIENIGDPIRDDLIFQIPFRSHGLFRTAPNKGLFSVVSLESKPDIYIYHYPDFAQVAKINGAAQTELLDICFTYTKLMITLSGRPDYEITIWNWETQVTVCRYGLVDGYIPEARVSSCLCNWRDFCIVGERFLKVFTIDQGTEADQTKSVICERPLQFPYSLSSPSKHLNDVFQTVDTWNPQDFTSLGAAAQVPADLCERFTYAVLGRARVCPTCYTWHIDGGLYIGADDGSVFYFNIHAGTRDPTKLNFECMYGPITRILSFKEGLVVLNGDNEMRVVLMPSATEIQRNEALFPNEKVLNIWQIPLRDRWLALTDRAELSAVLPEGQIDYVVRSENLLSEYVAVAKLPDGIIVTLQKFGIIKFWVRSNEPGYIYQLNVEGSAIACSPCFPCLVLGSTTGCVYVLDCSKLHAPRLLLSMRLFPSAITRIRFDASAEVIMVSGGDHNTRLIILSGLPSKAWRPLGFVNIPGYIVDFQGMLDGDGNVFVVVGTDTESNSKVSTELVTFRLSPTLRETPVEFYASDLGHFTDKRILMQREKLPLPICAFGVDNPQTIFMATATKHVIQARNETWGRTPDIVCKSEPASFPITQLRLVYSPGKMFCVVVDKTGSTSVHSGKTCEIVAEDKVCLGNIRDVLVKCLKNSFLLYLITAEGELVSRIVPFSEALSPEKAAKLSAQQQKELESMKSANDSSDVLLLPYSPRIQKTKLQIEASEPWLHLKARELQEKIDAEFLARSDLMKTSFSVLKNQVTQLYEQNYSLDGIHRLRDDFFELLDESWIKLKRQREKDVDDAKTAANLEAIEQKLYREKLLTTYWKPLQTKHHTIFGMEMDIKVTNFPIKKRHAAMKVTNQRVHLQRELEQELEQKAKLQAEQKGHVSQPVSLGSQDYAKRIMELICGPGTQSKKKLFEDLYADDVVTSRIQRVHQVTLLRECGLVLKEEFNRQFDAFLRRKLDMLNMLHKKYHLIVDKLIIANQEPEQLPILEVHKEEDPRTTMYEVSEAQMLDYMKLHHMPVPHCLNCNDHAYNSGTPAFKNVTPLSKAVTPVRSLSALHSNHLSDDHDKAPEVLLAEIQQIIKIFDKDLGDLARLKDRVTFAVGVVELRAMFLRHRMLVIEELTTRSAEIHQTLQRTTETTHQLKANLLRARKVCELAHDDYEKFMKRDAMYDHFVKRELHEIFDLDGRKLVQIYRKRPHLFRGLKQAKPVSSGQVIRPRTSELKEQVINEFFDTLLEIEDTTLRPENIEVKVWNKFCELRRRKMELEMEFWIKHVDLQLYHRVYKDYATLDKQLQPELNDIKLQLADVERNQNDIERNVDLILTLTHGQVDTEVKPFGEFSGDTILIPLERISKMNDQLKAECDKKMIVLSQLVKYREAILLLQWERQVYEEKMVDYAYEYQFIRSQAAPKEFRKMVGKDFSEYREAKYLQLRKNIKQQKKTFKKDLFIWEEKLRMLQQKLLGFKHERHNAEATMQGLTVELIERHSTGENIEIHAHASESEMRQALVLRRLRLQAKVKQQKKRMEELTEELWRWQKRTFPAIYRDTRNL